MTYCVEGTNSGQISELADKQNCKVVWAGPRELLVDLDTEEDMTQFMRAMRIIARFVSHYTVQDSQSGGSHKHVTVTMRDDLGELERCLLQAILGSDRMREAQHYVEYKCGRRGVLPCFFEPRGSLVLKGSHDTYGGY